MDYWLGSTSANRHGLCLCDLLNGAVGQDNSSVGIRATLTRLDCLLEQADPDLYTHLQVKNKVSHPGCGWPGSQIPWRC